MIMVVKGAKSLKPGLSITMSPGRRPRGSFDTHGQSSPMSAIRTPAVMSRRCIAGGLSWRSASKWPAAIT